MEPRFAEHACFAKHEFRVAKHTCFAKHEFGGAELDLALFL